MKRIHKIVQSQTGSQIVDLSMMVRALPLIGFRHFCPCCGWKIQTFTHGGTSLRPRKEGYCPRCNSKPRHRWLWLYLKNHTEIFSKPMRVLHLSPAHSVSKSFRKLTHLNYISGDLHYRPSIQLKMDLEKSPFAANQFDAIICIHVLEHVVDDWPAMRSLFRMLKPGGWAIIAVPIRMDSETYEDPTITSPEDRKQHFGERDHMRFYGYDLIDRLHQVGFTIKTHYAKDLDQNIITKCGLKDNEVMFHCTKPQLPNNSYQLKEKYI
jgi:predicted SAM-dependent methyltransferase